MKDELFEEAIGRIESSARLGSGSFSHDIRNLIAVAREARAWVDTVPAMAQDSPAFKVAVALDKLGKPDG